jgi:hypothetical protein
MIFSESVHSRFLTHAPTHKHSKTSVTHPAFRRLPWKKSIMDVFSSNRSLCGMPMALGSASPGTV